MTLFVDLSLVVVDVHRHRTAHFTTRTTALMVVTVENYADEGHGSDCFPLFATASKSRGGGIPRIDRSCRRCPYPVDNDGPTQQFCNLALETDEVTRLVSKARRKSSATKHWRLAQLRSYRR